MSQQLINLNPDLARLRSEGYDVSVGESGHLITKGIPYVNCAKQVKRGTLVSDLDLAGEATVQPKSHVVFFAGEYPCDSGGSPLPGVSPNTNRPLGEGLSPNHQISRKPSAGPTPGKYIDYYDKIKTYIDIIVNPVLSIDSKATAKVYPIVEPAENESVFRYLDTAATKSGIVSANHRLEGQKIAIIGVGGTGAYILDLVAKCPVAEIHIFDHDFFLNHNAFRCPGAASIEVLKRKLQKVEYLAALYSYMHKKVIPHDYFIDESSVEGLKDMSFVFLSIDRSPDKRLIVERLLEWKIPFIDVGMGIQLGDENALGGILTVTTGTVDKFEHLEGRIAYTENEAANEYSNNVQIADLNALNASLAVIKWKKCCGYYSDNRKEHFCAYTIRTNHLISEDTNEE